MKRANGIPTNSHSEEKKSAGLNNDETFDDDGDMDRATKRKREEEDDVSDEGNGEQMDKENREEESDITDTDDSDDDTYGIDNKDDFGDGTGPDGEYDDHDKNVDRSKDYKHEIVANQKTFVNDLNEDCLVKIFGYVKKVRRIQLVCKKWAKTITDNRATFMCAFPRQLEFFETDHRKRQQTKVHCIVGNMGYEKELHCLPENFFNKMFTICPNEMTIPHEVNMKLIKQAFDKCPEKYFHGLYKLEMTFNWMSKDDWSWLISRAPFLTEIEIEIMHSRSKKTQDKEPKVRIAKLLAEATGHLNNLKIDDYNYTTDGDELIDALIKSSHNLPLRPGWSVEDTPPGKKRFTGGHGYVRIMTRDDPNPMRSMMIGAIPKESNGIPIAKIIEFIEKAKFWDHVTLQLSYSGSIAVMNDWVKSNTDGEKGEDNDPGQVDYNFTYRGSKFVVNLFAE